MGCFGSAGATPLLILSRPPERDASGASTSSISGPQGRPRPSCRDRHSSAMSSATRGMRSAFAIGSSTQTKGSQARGGTCSRGGTEAVRAPPHRGKRRASGTRGVRRDRPCAAVARSAAGLRNGLYDGDPVRRAQRLASPCALSEGCSAKVNWAAQHLQDLAGSGKAVALGRARAPPGPSHPSAG